MESIGFLECIIARADPQPRMCSEGSVLEKSVRLPVTTFFPPPRATSLPKSDTLTGSVLHWLDLFS